MTSDQSWWLTMPPAELAATILPLFSHNAKSHVAEGGALKAIASWCRTGSYHNEPFVSPGGVSALWFDDPDYRAVAEAIQVLDHASFAYALLSQRGRLILWD